MLIAPIYPPAAAFEQPVGTPHVLSLENASLADLMSVPAALGDRSQASAWPKVNDQHADDEAASAQLHSTLFERFHAKC